MILQEVSHATDNVWGKPENSFWMYDPSCSFENGAPTWEIYAVVMRLKWILKSYLFLFLFLLILAGSFPVDEVLNLSEKKAHGLSLTVVIFFLALCSILNLYQPTGDSL